MTQFYAFFCFILTHQLCSRHCLYRANIATYASAAVPFLTAILHRGLRNCFFLTSNLHFPYSFWTFIPLSLWTFISLFYLDIFFSILFQLVFNSFLFFFICFSILFQFFFIQLRSHFGFLPNFWLLAYFSGSFGDQNTEQLYLKIIKGIFSVFSNFIVQPDSSLRVEPHSCPLGPSI